MRTCPPTGPQYRYALDAWVASLPGHVDIGLPLAAARAGGLGLLNLTLQSDAARAGQAAAELARLSPTNRGLALRSPWDDVGQAALSAAGQTDVVLLEFRSAALAEAVAEARRHANRVGVIVASSREAELARQAGCDLLAAKGHDGGGLVGEETSFVLVQALRRATELPLYVWGGVSWNTAAACLAAGCAGVVLDWQLSLYPESPLSSAQRRRIAGMDGSEIATLDLDAARRLRFFQQPGTPAKARLSEQLATYACAEPADWADALATTLEAMPGDAPLMAGQDAAFAADWVRQADSVGRALRRLESRCAAQVRAAAQAQVLAPGAPLAESHGTEFPVVQGPMTRVSDVAEFCQAVAADGGLPFLALALMEGSAVRGLLQRTRDLLGDKPWGVGMLGFVPQEIRAAQWPVIQEFRPRFAIIAGGRPDQAASLEAHGIATYLHVPSPGMLDVFLKEKARRFVFEGRECGGHVGPRTSFVLWELMVRVLCEADLTEAEAADVHVLFAGGIHDSLGGAMVSALAQPLAERGMKVGVLLGTAYLFTHEIVATGAVVDGFQSVALATDGTVVVESGPGHAIRCAKTDFVELFNSEKQRMLAEQRPPEEVRETLEHLNLGRLRIAAKGVARSTGGRNLEQIDSPQQRRDGMYMIGQVAALRQSTCSIRELHADVCQGAVDLLAREAPADIVPVDERPTAPPPLDIAIVGMACFLPGGANDPGRFWHNLLMRDDPIGEIPPDRFEAERWFDEDRHARDKIYGKWGGFVDDLPFNPLKYGIPPASIPSIEPMQLLAMELVDRALRDAGYAEHNPHLERTSVILGVGGGAGELGANYSFRSMLPRFIAEAGRAVWEQLPEWTEDSFAGILFNVVAGRVSNRFDFGGTNCTIDAACASSLAAIYWACQELALGRCDLAISGGCDTMQNPFGYLCFAKAGALSPRGRSRVFDAGADGIVISEGHAALVLKRRAEAERDGDKIYAVIRAVASGSDGRSKGLTAPRVEGQLRTLRRAYAQARINPATVELFEAHGTGTAVGDQTEGLSLATLLTEAGARPHAAAVGSAKSLVGHTKSAAGAVGVIKSVLALQHRVLPPTLHVERPNPKAGLVDGPLYVNRDARPWLAGAEPRRAGVSAFGFGGTNFHLVLEEYDRGASAPPLAPRRDRSWELFLVKADQPRGLRDAARALADEAERVAQADLDSGLARLALTHHLRVEGDKPLVAALLVRSLDELVVALRAFAEQLDDQGNVRGKLPGAVSYEARPLRGPIAFLFPGQGSQHPGMLQELAVEFPELAACFERADRELAEPLDARLSSYIFPPPAFTDEERARAAEELKQTRIAQPALGVCGWALARLLEQFGIRSARNAGHSFGELVALANSGVWGESGLFRVAAARGRSMTRAAGESSGAMLAVSAAPEVVREKLRGIDGVGIANRNAPTQTVLSGSEAGIAAAAKAFESAGIAARRLPVAAAFHSPFMREAQCEFEAALAREEIAMPATPVYSNVTAAAYDGDATQTRRLLSEQLTREVRFVEQIEAMHRDGARIFLEVGPKGVLTGLVRDILRDREHAAVATQSGPGDPLRQFLGALAQLAAHGVPVALDRLYRGRGLEPLDRATLAGRSSEKLPAHVWLVNGSYARKLGEPRRSTAPRASMQAPSPVQPARAAAPERSLVASSAANGHAPDHEANGNGAPRSEPVSHSQPTPPTPTHNSSAPPRRESGDMQPDDYAAFQETMRQFLATQEFVLKQLFGGADSSPRAAEVPRRVATPRIEQQPATEPNEPAETRAVSREPEATRPIAAPTPREHRTTAPQLGAGAPRAVEPAAGADRSDLLMQIVSDRTGYPPDMLELDVNLESDLGIDSIKRVEIIAAFRREVRPDMLEPPPELMERLTAAKTMRAILDCFAEPAAANTPPTVAAVARPAPRAERLCEIVSERTGYPTDMLELDVNLESDLGIDSIKRVEIIAAFRREVRPDMLEPPPELMERLTAAKTMRAILDCFAEPAAANTPPTVAAVARPAPRAERLCEIVSERTGYPTDMLELDVNLESDLGIDSIKRVEIIAAFRREVRPDMLEPPPELMERLTAAKTMRAILDCFAEPGPTQAVDSSFPLTPSSIPSTPDDEPLDACPRCVPWVVETPIQHQEQLAPGVVIFTPDDRGLAERWSERLAAAGRAVAILSRADLVHTETARAAVDGLRRQHGAIAALVHLTPLTDSAAWPEISTEAWRAHSDVEVKGLLHLLQALEPELSRAGQPTFRVLAASQGGGDFFAPDLAISSDGEASRPWRAGVAALLKVAACEWTGAMFRAVDFIAPPELPVLERELLASGPVEIGYRRGLRLSLDVRRADLSATEQDTIPFDSDGVVLVTGGAKGITAQIVAEFAERAPARFVLLGRSPLPEGAEPADLAAITDDTKLRQAIIARLRSQGAACAPPLVEAELARIKSDREVRKNLAAIRQTGATVDYVPCDLGNGPELERVLDALLARYGAVQALIHGAGIIEDRAIKDKTDDSFDRVVSVKVDPLLTLLRRLDPLALKLVALFASTSGYFGNSGQCDYAVANETLNRLARRLRSGWHGRVVALNWGPWSGAGMVTPEVAEKMRSRGVSLIPLAAGRAAAWRELSAAADVDIRPILGRGPWLEGQSLRPGELCDAAGPLLRGQRIERHADGRVTASVVLDCSQPYLHDHCIDGKAVLPVAMAVGLMAETAHAAEPNWHVSALENVRMLSGITVEPPQREIVVTAEPLERGPARGTWRVRISAPEMPQRSLYDAHVQLASALPEGPWPRSPQPIESPLGASAGEAYERWLFHGPTYQVIESFTGADERGIDAVVRRESPAARRHDQPWIVDPVLVDAAPQLAMIWSRALFDVAVLPSRITRYRLYEPVGEGDVQMMLRMRPGQDRQVYQADVWIMRDGRVLAHMEGLEGAGSASLNRIATHATP